MEIKINLQQVIELLQNEEGEFCIHCDKESMAEQLLSSVEKIGYKWVGGNVNNELFWNQHHENTCYFFRTIHQYIGYADVNFAMRKNYTIYYLTDESQNYSELIERLNDFLTKHYPEQNFETTQNQNQVVISGDTNLVIFPDTEQISISLDTNLELVNKIQSVVKSFKTPLYYVLIDIEDEYATNLPYLAKTKNGFEIVKQTILSEYSLKELLFTDAEYNELRASNPALTYNLLTVEYC